MYDKDLNRIFYNSQDGHAELFKGAFEEKDKQKLYNFDLYEIKQEDIREIEIFDFLNYFNPCCKNVTTPDCDSYFDTMLSVLKHTDSLSFVKKNKYLYIFQKYQRGSVDNIIRQTLSDKGRLVLIALQHKDKEYLRMEVKYCGRSKMLGELKVLYNSALGADSETKFMLVQKYLRFVESNSESISNVFYGKDPLAILKDDRKFFQELENWCLQVLGAANGPNNMTLFKDAPQVQARAYLGLVYEIGACGLKKSIEKAISLYASAAKQNNAFATFRLAQCFESGKGKQLNIEKSITFYRCAAKLGGIEAMHIYGSILIHGELGLRKDISQGLFYLKLAAQAASKHYPYPFYDLARCYENEEDAPEITVDHEYALELFEKGAKLGDPNCQYKIAKAYATGGLSCEINLDLALQWYTSAAEYEQIDAMYELAHLKLMGIENLLEKNYDDAYYLALRAAAKGHVDAAFLVGECIENGVGVRQDPLHAMWWFTISKALGNDKAGTKITELRKIVGGAHNSTFSPQGCRMF